MDTEQGLHGEVEADRFEQAGLSKENIGDLNFYTLDIGSNKVKETLDHLKEIVQAGRVAVEVGPGSQLDSLFFAADYAKADVVIGIDPYFDFSSIQPLSKVEVDKVPTVILMKGDAWGNRQIHDFFGTYEEDRSKRLAVYSQIVSPDTNIAEALISPVRSFSKDGFMIVFDSGAVEMMGNQRYPEHAIENRIMAEKGIPNPTHLDWIKNVYRNEQQTEIDRVEYERGISEKKYPPSSFLRNGKMLVIQRTLSVQTVPIQ